MQSVRACVHFFFFLKCACRQSQRVNTTPHSNYRVPSPLISKPLDKKMAKSCRALIAFWFPADLMKPELCFPSSRPSSPSTRSSPPPFVCRLFEGSVAGSRRLNEQWHVPPGSWKWYLIELMLCRLWRRNGDKAAHCLFSRLCIISSQWIWVIVRRCIAPRCTPV